MSVGINVNQIRSAQYNPASSNKLQDNKARTGGSGSSFDGKKTATARSLEYQQKQAQKPASVVDQAMAYANTLKASRTKQKDASLEKKKLQYSYKKISSQIVRSKNSTSAKRAASAARREVQRLKRLQNSGEYDEEELQISIEHAKSMERVAKKKAAHLAQEEMIERGQNGAMASLEEKEEEIRENEEYEDEALSEEEAAALEEEQVLEEGYPEEYVSQFQIEMSDLQEEMAYRMEELAAQMQEQIAEVQENSSQSMDELNADMMSMVQDAMEEMTEALDLTELASSMVAPNPNMSEDDLKMLKIKHRTKEMKEISEADGAYLKAIFDKYEKDAAHQGASAASAAASSQSPVSGSGASFSPTPISVTVPGSYGGEGGGVSFDAFV